MAEEYNGEDGDDATRKRMAELVPALALGEDDAYRTVTDADEEVFLLYTLAAPAADRTGLGQLDSVRDSLTISVNLSDPHCEPVVEAAVDRASDRYANGHGKRRKDGAEPRAAEEKHPVEQDLLRVTLRQDSTSLRSNAGDTGSVVWRSSAFFAVKMLHDISEAHRRSMRPATRPTDLSTSILSWEYLMREAKTTIVEIGAGTGVLPCLCLSHPIIVASPSTGPRWIATDQASIVPLLRKNTIQCAPRACATALDWQDASQVYSHGAASARRAFMRDLFGNTNDDDEDHGTASAHADIVIATDCVYNPHLFPALIDTLSLCAQPKHTIVLIVCELREVDMLRDFLRLWLEHKARWCINTIESPQVLGPHLTRGSAVWAAWRRE